MRLLRTFLSNCTACAQQKNPRTKTRYMRLRKTRVVHASATPSCSDLSFVTAPEHIYSGVWTTSFGSSEITGWDAESVARTEVAGEARGSN